MYSYYNAHPTGLITDDCTKRAICASTCIPYKEVQRALNRCKRITGAKWFYSNGNPHYYVEKVLGCQRISFQKTVGDFCALYPKGRYVLDLEGHWTAVIDGICYDTHDCLAQKVNFAYDMTPAVLPNATLPPLRYCFTVEQTASDVYTIRFYDGNGAHSCQKVPAGLLAGYQQCHFDFGYHRAPLPVK